MENSLQILDRLGENISMEIRKERLRKYMKSHGSDHTRDVSQSFLVDKIYLAEENSEGGEEESSTNYYEEYSNESGSTNLNDVQIERQIVEFLKEIMQQERNKNDELINSLHDQIEFLKSELSLKQKIIENLLDNRRSSIESQRMREDTVLHDGELSQSFQRGSPLGSSTKHCRCTMAQVFDSFNISGRQEKISIEIIGDSLLSGIRERGLARKGDAKIRSYSGCTSEELKIHADSIIAKSPDVIILHVGTCDIEAGIDTIKNLEEVIRKINSYCRSTTKVAISSVITRKDKKDMEEDIDKLNKEIASLCKRNGICFIDNENIDESCLKRNKIHLTRHGNSRLACNFIRYIENL